MKARVLREWLLYYVPNIPDEAISGLLTSFRDGGGNLIRDAFEDRDGRECLATFIGRRHPAFKNSSEPGPAFLRFIGLPLISHVVNEWDTNPLFEFELETWLKRERFYRKGGRSCVSRTAKKLPKSASAF